jgi:5'-3' exoribonuclease 2
VRLRLTNVTIHDHLAEERQDKGDKRRRIEAEHRTGGTHLQNGHDYVSVQKLPVPHSAGPILPHVLPASSSLAAGPSSLPARPSWVATPEDPVIKLEQIASMVGGSNSSIVANRVAIRMANLNAAQMLKAELDGSSMIATPVVVDKTAVASNMSAAERLRLEMMGGVESSSEVTEVEDVVKVEDVVELSPAGVKRKAEEDLVKEVVEGVDVEVAIEADEEDDEEDESEEDAPVGAILPVVLPGGHAGTPQLVLMGNNVAEQEDIVKYVLFITRFHLTPADFLSPNA